MYRRTWLGCSWVGSLFVALTWGLPVFGSRICPLTRGLAWCPGMSAREDEVTARLRSSLVPSRRGSRDIEHIESVHNEAELESLMACGPASEDGRPGRCPSRPRGWDTCWTPSGTLAGPWGWGTRLRGYG